MDGSFPIPALQQEAVGLSKVTHISQIIAYFTSSYNVSNPLSSLDQTKQYVKDTDTAVSNSVLALADKLTATLQKQNDSLERITHQLHAMKQRVLLAREISSAGFAKELSGLRPASVKVKKVKKLEEGKVPLIAKSLPAWNHSKIDFDALEKFGGNIGTSKAVDNKSTVPLPSRKSSVQMQVNAPPPMLSGVPPPMLSQMNSFGSVSEFKQQVVQQGVSRQPSINPSLASAPPMLSASNISASPPSVNTPSVVLPPLIFAPSATTPSISKVVVSTPSINNASVRVAPPMVQTVGPLSLPNSQNSAPHLGQPEVPLPPPMLVSQQSAPSAVIVNPGPPLPVPSLRSESLDTAPMPPTVALRKSGVSAVVDPPPTINNRISITEKSVGAPLPPANRLIPSALGENSGSRPSDPRLSNTAPPLLSAGNAIVPRSTNSEVVVTRPVDIVVPPVPLNFAPLSSGGPPPPPAGLFFCTFFF